MDNYKFFCEQYPIKEAELSCGKFCYRYYENTNSKTTVVLLVGGLGLSDLIYTHFLKFAEYYSVLTFDYSIQYETNEKLVEVIGELVKKLDKKVWFVGQSLGGFVAQNIAIKYPEITEGLVLSNTGCASTDLNETAYNSLLDMIKSSKKSKRILRCVPFSLFKKLLSKKIIKRYAQGYSYEERALLRSACDIMEEKLTKKYELHMISLLIDLKNYFGSNKAEFEYLSGKVLLILSEDDKTFHDEVKKALIALMTKPTVVTDLVGGHLSLMVNCDEYVRIIVNFISGLND